MNAIKNFKIPSDIKKFRLLKFYICYLRELLHRYVFDNHYQQDFPTTKKTKIAAKLDLNISSIYWDFKAYLRHWKPIIIRAYNQKRIRSIQLFIVWRLIYTKPRNYIRYTDYQALRIK